MSQVDIYSTCEGAIRVLRGTKVAPSVWNFPDLKVVNVTFAPADETVTFDGFEGQIGWVKYRSEVLLSEFVSLELDYEKFGNPLFAEWVDGDSFFRIFQDPSSKDGLKQIAITEGATGEPYIRQIVHVMGGGQSAKYKVLKYHVYYSIDENGCTQREFDAFAGFLEHSPSEGAQ
jgi:hypothetical protein